MSNYTSRTGNPYPDRSTTTSTDDDGLATPLEKALGS